MTEPLGNKLLVGDLETPSSSKKQSYLNQNILSRALFQWVTPFLEQNERQPFEQGMHNNLRPSEASENQFHDMSIQWEKATTASKKRPLYYTILRTYSRSLLFVTLLALVKVALFFTTPAIIGIMMHYVQQPAVTTEQALGLLLFVPVARVLTTLVTSNANYLLELLGLRLKFGLVGLLYSKSLKISILQSKEHSVGSIVNHYEIDCEKLRGFMNMAQDLITIPFQIAIGISVVYFLIGNAFLGGLLVVAFVSILAYYLSKKNAYYQEQFMSKKDARMKLLNETLNAIKYIKMNGWEAAFIKRISDARRQEITILRKQFILYSFWVLNFIIGPQGVFMATLGIYIAAGNEFEPAKIITLGSTFWILSGPFQRVASVISTAIDCNVSVKRLESFLTSPEVDHSYIKQAPLTVTSALKVQNGNFFWQPEEQKQQKNEKSNLSKLEMKLSTEAVAPYGAILLNDNGDNDVRESNRVQNEKFSLKNIELDIKKGQLAIVIGDIGSGKSSLFYSLIGEMAYPRASPPSVSVNGSTGFLPQKPWIINATLRDNITFGKPFDQHLYDTVIACSAMKSDLAILSHGDMTEIGEKGINLSGGQKARVATGKSSVQPAGHLPAGRRTERGGRACGDTHHGGVSGEASEGEDESADHTQLGLCEVR